MAKKPEFVKEAVVKNYMRGRKIRSRDDAVENLAKRFNAVIARVVVESGKVAKKKRKKTVTKEHVVEAFVKHVGKEDLGWEEILAQVLNESPADLGKISKGIRDHMAQNKT